MKVRESAMPPEELWVTFFDPPQVLARLLFDGSGDVAEFGCGYGTFTVAAAKRTKGEVYAFDIEPDMLAATAAKARELHLDNVRTIRRDFLDDGTGLPDASTRFAMLFNILHAPEPMLMIEEAARILQPAGRVGVIHWNPSGTPRGPDPSIRPKPEQCAAWLESAGFSIELSPSALPPFHFGLVGRKPK